MANALFRSRFGPSAVTVLAIASNLPDIDAVVHLTGDPAAVLMRRTFGHSVFLLPFWSAILALIFWRFYPKIGFVRLFGLVLLGASVHLVFDLVNSFGVVLLWPFEMWRPEWAIVFIIDLFLTGLLAAPVILSVARGLKPYRVLMSRISLIAVAVYILFCGGNRILARNALAAETEKLGKPADFSYVFPEPLGPHHWRGVTRSDGVYRIYLIHSLSNRIELIGEDRSDRGNPAVERTRNTERGRKLEWFFKAPVWKAEMETVTDRPSSDRPETVSVYDLRFRPVSISTDSIFLYRFHVFADGRVEPFP